MAFGQMGNLKLILCVPVKNLKYPRKYLNISVILSLTSYSVGNESKL